MIPTKPPEQPIQSAAPGWSWSYAGIPATESPVLTYAMVRGKDTWVYFGDTKFPASSEQAKETDR